MIKIILFSVSGVLFILCLFLVISLRRRDKKQEVVTPNANLRHCPLCDQVLQPKEKVKSIVYSISPDSPDKRSEIYGCRYCYPVNNNNRRICPVCKKELSPDGYVIARMFDRKPKIHVHVLGCTGCYKRNKT